MAIIASVMSVLVAIMGVLGITRPDKLIALVRRFRTPGGLYAAAVMRVIMGLALIMAAPASRATKMLRVLGIIIVAAGILLPFIGFARFSRIVDWWSGMRLAYQRLWSIAALAFGILAIYALLPAV